MATDRTLTWLHLSDIHRCSTRDSGGGEIALQRLSEDLKKLGDEHELRPDLIFMTGDLAFGQLLEKPLAEQLLDGWTWLGEICKLYAPKIPANHVFLVPGNHDIDCGKVGEMEQEWLRSLAARYEKDRVRRFLYEGGQTWRHFMSRLECYEAFIAEHCPHLRDAGGRCIYSAVRMVAGLKVGVAGFNSAWSCGSGDDKGHLWLGEWQLEQLASKLLEADVDVRIALVHHPFNWLVESEDPDLKTRLQGNFHVLLHGHEHRSWVETPQPNHLHIAAGAVLDHANAVLSYNLVRFDLGRKKGEVWLRTFDHRTDQWKADNVPGSSDERGVWQVSAPWEGLGISIAQAPGEVAGSERIKDGLRRSTSDPRLRDDFLSRVEQVCRLHEKDAKVDRVRFGHSSREYLRLTISDSGIAHMYPVGAEIGQVTSDVFADFLAIHLEYQQLDNGVISVLVYGGDPPADGLARLAREQRVLLKSFVEYQGLIDFHKYLERQTRDLSTDAAYLPGHYIKQGLRYKIGQAEGQGEDALATVRDWLLDERGRFILVLGDFGTGKSFLLRELARRMGEEGGRVVPILIELRALEKSHDLDVLVAQHLVRSGMDAEPEKFRYMLKVGRAALLFDGFDELALRVSYDHALEHFAAITAAAQGNAKVVVTSRTQHFESDRQVRTALAEKVALRSGSRIVYLQPFDQRRIRRFLVARLKSETAADQHAKLLDEIKDLMGLAENPRMLAFISELSEDELRQARSATGDVTAASLYQVLLDRWLRLEVERREPLGAPRALSNQQCWDAVHHLALCLWEWNERSTHLSGLTAKVEQVVKALTEHGLTLAETTHQVGSGTLLVRDDEGRFSFIHRSVLEWLVARAAAKQLCETGRASVLAKGLMSPLMAEFFRQLVGNERARQWVQHALEAESEKTKRNALVVRQCLDAAGAEVRMSLRLVGENLRGRDFSRENLEGSDFTDADLTSATFIRARLARASMHRAKLIGADLRDADLRDADLRDADLSAARLLGADLRGVRWQGSVLRRTKLVGAQLDDGALAAARPLEAAWPRPSGVLAWHRSSVSQCRTVAWSPDGGLLATGHDDGTVRLWDVATGHEICRFLGHPSAVRGVSFSPEGTLLASGSEDRTVRLWDVSSGKKRLELEGHAAAVRSVSFSPDGSLLASGSSDHTVCLWDIPSGNQRHRLREPFNAVWSVCFNPGGSLLACGSDDLTVWLWDIFSGQARYRHRLEGHQDAVRSVSFSPDGSFLASGSEDRTVRLWEVSSGKVRHRLTGHQDAVRSVSFSPDGSLLASGSDDRTLWLWDVSFGQVQYQLPGHQGAVRVVSFSPKGSLLASGSDHTVRLWDVSSGKQRHRLTGHRSAVWTVNFSPEGTLLASGSEDRTVRLWDVSSGKERHKLTGHEKAVYSVSFSPKGTLLASGSDDWTVRLWDVSSGKVRHKLTGHEKAVHSVSFSPEGSLLASGSDDQTVWLWDVSSGRVRHQLREHRNAVWSVCFNPDGSLLASGSDDRIVRLWDTSSLRVRHQLTGHEGAVWSVAFSPDGSHLASGSEDNTVRLWDVASGRCLAVLLPLPEGWVAYTPAGRFKLGGETAGEFWHSIGLCRFEPGELDPYLDKPLRVPNDKPLF